MVEKHQIWWIAAGGARSKKFTDALELAWRPWQSYTAMYLWQSCCLG
jgi:3-methyladenine DNA glycosylase/8-oxoguanine DNA glycosylase